MQYRRYDMVTSHYKTRPERINRYGQQERGVTSIEYALIATLIAIAIIGSLLAVGGAHALNWATVAERVLAALGG